MKPFWGSFFDQLQQCGRDATIFLVALAVLMGITVGSYFVTDIIGANGLSDYGRIVLWGLVVLAVLLLLLAVRRAFSRRRRAQLRFSELSSDELAKARSKLVKARNVKGP